MPIKKCPVCKKYTMRDMHCNGRTRTAHPPKFSAADKYAKYRRMAKK